MAETPADVRRDIELTRERMSTTIDQLEQKLNVKQLIADHPWPALAVALGAGLALAGSRSEGKVAAAAAAATRDTQSRLGSAIDDLVTNLVTSATAALHQQVDRFVAELSTAMTTTDGRPAARGGYGVGPVDLDSERVPAPTPEIPRAD